MTEVTTKSEPAKVFESKAQHIRQLRAENPDMPAPKIAEIAKTSETYVYMTLSAGKPKKHKKVKPTQLPEKVVTDGQKVLRKEIAELNAANDKWRSLSTFQEQRIKHLNSEVQKLKEHLVGHEYVISYLESRLGLNEANGATV